MKSTRAFRLYPVVFFILNLWRMRSASTPWACTRAASAEIRSFRPPEPYKGKGIKYAEETIVRKAGKTAGK